MIKLSNTFSIQLMKEDNEGNSLEALNNSIIKNLTAVYGGVTIEEVTGTWMNKEGELFEDASLMVSVSFDKREAVRGGFFYAIKREFKQGRQEAVIIRLDGTTYILDNYREALEVLDF